MNIRNQIKTIANKYDVEVVSIIGNIQNSLDVELDHPIYYKENEKMEEEMRGIKGIIINDIFYREN